MEREIKHKVVAAGPISAAGLLAGRREPASMASPFKPGGAA